MSVERIQAMMTAACLAADAEAALTGDLGGFLARHGLASDDVEALLAAPRRLGLYRRLVRSNVVGVVRAMLGRTEALVERFEPGGFERAIAGFLDEVGPRTAHLRDVPREFLDWAGPRWRASERLPAWLVDHAELELVDFTVEVAPRPGPLPALADVAPDRALVFAEPRVVARLGWAVHAMSGEGEAPPERRDVVLLVYRDAEHRARYLELSPVAAAILEQLFAGRPLVPAVVEACREVGQTVDDAVLAGAARLLADLGERGVLLGARGE